MKKIVVNFPKLNNEKNGGTATTISQEYSCEKTFPCEP